MGQELVRPRLLAEDMAQAVEVENRRQTQISVVEAVATVPHRSQTARMVPKAVL